ncbi:hypothetical protein vseg_003298 [Gypsophila vaccaria]
MSGFGKNSGPSGPVSGGEVAFGYSDPKASQDKASNVGDSPSLRASLSPLKFSSERQRVSPSTAPAPATGHNDTQREEHAKAKRLARFKTELHEPQPEPEPEPSGPPSVHVHLPQEYDNEDLLSTHLIVGICPDMCPDSERGERQRKGDLDRYERLDGDRNHTTKFLAVKKYNRTAEREPHLIRPMPILHKTMDYLLRLLAQPYDHTLLALYNFLWDRMRAIRMDLRMQHIFNLKAITMLEQMIRLHVLAMHELCEFSKGEGFSEGFDAHLNIEQMNKTSVELFQLYDDHRKRGIYIPTEKEFRGYYALLKLDKHPGYKVEPAELSLDLSKMTAEIRQTQEILFARDVARSCRTGNFIAFFRHARKASYLQACLMHAHFSKLRTQALAALHSGLQYGQGLPVTHVAKWLGMEGEDTESLLEYHGFLIKEFEEPYMVKEGPFLHDDKDYPTRCSRLVHGKKSDTIVEDVSSSQEILLPSKTKTSEKNSKPQHVQKKSSPNVFLGREKEVGAVSPVRGSMQAQSVLDRSSGVQAGLVPGAIIGQPFNDQQRVSAGSPRSQIRGPKAFANLQSPVMREKPSPLTPNSNSLILGNGQLSDNISPGPLSNDLFILSPRTSTFVPAKQDEFKGPIQTFPSTTMHSENNATPLSPLSVNVRELTPSDSEVALVNATSPVHCAFPEVSASEEFTDVQEKVEEDVVIPNFDKEVAEAKLRLLIRLWRRRYVRKKKLHEYNRLAASAALGSLSLGPPLWQSKDKPVHSPTLNIDKAVHERYEKWQESRVRWNVADLVAAKLAEKNANSVCVCWKLVTFSWSHHVASDFEARSSVTHLSLDEWIRYKLIPAIKDETTEGLAVSAPGLSVWKKWAPKNTGGTACYFSVVKDTTSGNTEMNLVGANAVLFPISETVPLDVQRIRLHNLAMSIPFETRTPLLIISGSRREDVADISVDIVAKLGLEELDKSRVGSYSVICLNEREDTSRFHGYFSDQKLKNGLIWLVSESCPPPTLSSVTTRELVSLHLNLCLDPLQHMGSDRVGPNQCISTFNEALDRTINDIVTSAKANPNGWPCPELYLLDNSTAEFRAVKQYLPSLGWSSSTEVEPLTSALVNCKLPHFSDDLSLLGRGCNIEEEIEEQKQFLHDCLIRYLTQTSNVMHWMMAAKEATLMVQNYTRLQLHDTEFKIVPSWVLMFRRVFNWQLNSAATFTTKAYVLEQSNLTYKPRFLKQDMDVHIHDFSGHPPLEEMVEVSCSPIVSKRVRTSPKSFRNVAPRTSGENTADVTLSRYVLEEKNYCSDVQIQSVDDSDTALAKSDLELVTKDDEKDDRLIQLLNQCNILQDEIEKKLSIYF